MPVAMTLIAVGDAVYRVRTARNLTRDELAIRSGLHRNTILRIEKGDSPTLIVLASLAIGLDIDLWRLMKFAESLAPKIVHEVVNP